VPIQRFDLTSQVFPPWRVLSWHGKKPRGTHGDYTHQWNVECITCGKLTVLTTDGLHHLHQRECWHWKDELIGQKFGRLLVVEKLDRDKYGNQQWRCVCDCGQPLISKTASLVSANTESCGCLRFDAWERKRGCKFPNRSLGHGVSSFNVLVRDYEKGAFLRGYKWSLTNDQAKILFRGNCFYCGVEPMRVFKGRTCDGAFICNGIDRKDGKRGYFKENCVSCCKRCNVMKMKMSTPEFLHAIKAIYRHSCARRRKNLVMPVDLSWMDEQKVVLAV
jgi:hypothetical protein